MIIDFHTHIGDLREDRREAPNPITWDNLMSRLDDEGIDKAVFLPVYNSSPEGSTPGIALLDDRMSVRDQVLDAGRFPDRIIPFGNMDPRWLLNSPETDFSQFLAWFIDHGCKGIGEVMVNLPIDDPRVVNMFRQIGEKGLLVVIESSGMETGPYGLQDDPGAPRLERLLQAVPETTIIGHGPGFWAEISATLSPMDKWHMAGYPKGPIRQEGALWRLMRQYPNLHADISANSGRVALTRDPEWGIRFFNEFQDKVMFGTDTCFADTAGRMPHLNYLKKLRDESRISEEAFDKIAGRNAESF